MVKAAAASYVEASNFQSFNVDGPASRASSLLSLIVTNADFGVKVSLKSPHHASVLRRTPHHPHSENVY
jgi:hypothetical protein